MSLLEVATDDPENIDLIFRKGFMELNVKNSIYAQAPVFWLGMAKGNKWCNFKLFSHHGGKGTRISNQCMVEVPNFYVLFSTAEQDVKVCVGMTYAKTKLWCQRVTIRSDSVVLFLFWNGERKNVSQGTVGLPAMDRALTVRLEYKHTYIDDTFVFSF